MRALTIDAHGDLTQLRLRTDVPMPALESPTDVRVRVHAAALNHLDLHVLRGLPGQSIVAPWILGADGAGVVDAIGSAVTAVAVGDRVAINPGVSDGTCEFCRAGEQSMCVRFQILGEHRPGTFAEAVVVPATNVRRLPATVSFAAAAAATLVGVTAWRMVVTRARVTPGEDVLIWGIGGGVALAALALVLRQGAHAWVTSGSDEKLARAAALGATVVLNHRTTDIAREIRTRTGKRGIDVVIDSVGRETWGASLGALRRGGRLVTCGGTSGPLVETDVRRLFWNQWTIMGSTMGNASEFATVVEELGAGRLTVPIDRVVPLADARSAFERLAAGAQFGKIVLQIADGA